MPHNPRFFNEVITRELRQCVIKCDGVLYPYDFAYLSPTPPGQSSHIVIF